MTDTSVTMYDPTKLQIAVAEIGWSFTELARRARVNYRTAKKIVETGSGHPNKVKRVAKVLGFELKDIVKRDGEAA